MLLTTLLQGAALLHLVSARVIEERASANPYAPRTVTCTTPKVRTANSVGKGEASYIANRCRLADKALSSWIASKLKLSGEKARCFHPPRVALALSGGGPKAGLESAGVVKAFDARDSSREVRGLLQGMTYISALSGGSLTLSGVMVNNFSLISTLKARLYNDNYGNVYEQPLNQQANIAADITAKNASGYPSTIDDAYGRALAVDFIGGPNNASGETWSGLLKKSAFTRYEAPYPIITLTDAKVPTGQCFPNSKSVVWEVSPSEFGSWDQGVRSLYPTKYLGTSAKSKNKCTVGFDNAGFLTGISANILTTGSSTGCTPDGLGPLSETASLIEAVFGGKILDSAYGIVPNPFYKSGSAKGTTSSQTNLFMLDGGSGGQGIPITPFLQPEREIDVIIAADLLTETSRNITEGASLYTTYQAAKRNGLKNVPVLPTVAQIAKQNLTSHARFFGCNDHKVETIIYLPNTYSTVGLGSDFTFTPSQLNAVFNGGIALATQQDDPQWPACLACGIAHKKLSSLSGQCKKCLSKYCWKP